MELYTGLSPYSVHKKENTKALNGGKEKSLPFFF